MSFSLVWMLMDPVCNLMTYTRGSIPSTRFFYFIFLEHRCIYSYDATCKVHLRNRGQTRPSLIARTLKGTQTSVEKIVNLAWVHHNLHIITVNLELTNAYPIVPEGLQHQEIGFFWYSYKCQICKYMPGITIIIKRTHWH